MRRIFGALTESSMKMASNERPIWRPDGYPTVGQNDDCMACEAAFAIGDDPEVVAAAFACRMCLGQARLVLLSANSALAIALCRECDAETVVELTGSQVVQLAVDPPGSLPISLVA